MYSYPNYIPLSAAEVDGVVETIADIEFDRIHSHFPRLTIKTDAKAAVRRSAKRFKKAIGC